MMNTMTSSLRVGLVQQASCRDKQKSLAATRDALAELAKQNVQLVLLQEP